MCCLSVFFVFVGEFLFSIRLHGYWVCKRVSGSAAAAAR